MIAINRDTSAIFWENRRLIKGDFHLHTKYSDNKEKMCVADYIDLCKKRGIDIIGICDHHQNLTQESWQKLRAEVQAANNNGFPVSSGYEITFYDGHMGVLNKNNFDGEFVADSAKQMHDKRNVRVMHHPNNNICSWEMNLLPQINAIEIANGGKDIHTCEERSESNGLCTYKKYLLLRHKLAAMSQSDCHEAVYFARMWTGLVIPKSADTSTDIAIDAIMAGQTYASYGQLELEFCSSNGAIMGDECNNGNLLWNVSHDCEVELWYGDSLVGVYVGSGEHVPLMNGPYWIRVKRGLSFAVSSPIWYTGIEESENSIDEKLGSVQQDSLVIKLEAELENLFKLAKNIIHKNNIDYYSEDYVAWMSSFLIKNLGAKEIANKSVEYLILENRRRIELCIKIIRKHIADLLNTIKLEECDDTRIVVYNFGRKPLHGVVQAKALIPHNIGDFFLQNKRGDKIPFVARQEYVRNPIDGYSAPRRATELIDWLYRGEMHEYKIKNLKMIDAGSEMEIEFELFPQHMCKHGELFEAESAQLANYIETKKYERYRVRALKLREFILQIDVSKLDAKDIENTIYIIPSASGAIEMDQNAIFEQQIGDDFSSDIFFTMR